MDVWTVYSAAGFAPTLTFDHEDVARAYYNSMPKHYKPEIHCGPLRSTAPRCYLVHHHSILISANGSMGAYRHLARPVWDLYDTGAPEPKVTINSLGLGTVEYTVENTDADTAAQTFEEKKEWARVQALEMLKEELVT